MAHLLENHLLFHTQNPAQACAEVSKVHCEHKLRLKRGCSVDTYYYHAPLSTVSLNLLQYGAEVFITPGDLKDFYLIQIPVAGYADIRVNSEEIASRPGLSSVLSPGNIVDMHWSEDCQQVMVKIDRIALEQQLSSLISMPITKPILFEPAMPYTEGKQASWWRLIQYVLNELEHEDSLAMSPAAMSTFEQSIISNLLYAQPHNYSHYIYAKNQSIAPAHVKRAEEYIHENLTSPITIADLTKAASVSSRTLHAGFKHFRDTTPMNYVRSVRLEKARKDLMHGVPGKGVTDIATRWGFTQMGRFASCYKKTYGETPSETLLRYR